MNSTKNSLTGGRKLAKEANNVESRLTILDDRNHKVIVECQKPINCLVFPALFPPKVHTYKTRRRFIKEQEQLDDNWQ